MVRRNWELTESTAHHHAWTPGLASITTFDRLVAEDIIIRSSCFPGKKVGRFTSECAAKLNETFGISMFPENCNFVAHSRSPTPRFFSAVDSPACPPVIYFLWFPREMSSFCSTFRFTNSSSHVWFSSSHLLWPPAYFPYIWKSICNSSLELVLVMLLWFWFWFALTCQKICYGTQCIFGISWEG
jgi:hypothetical protein